MAHSELRQENEMVVEETKWLVVGQEGIKGRLCHVPKTLFHYLLIINDE